MALFSFYNTRKPRQFNHKPIYWDPHKEADGRNACVKLSARWEWKNRWKIISRRSKELLLKVLLI